MTCRCSDLDEHRSLGQGSGRGHAGHPWSVRRPPAPKPRLKQQVAGREGKRWYEVGGGVRSSPRSIGSWSGVALTSAVHAARSRCSVFQFGACTMQRCRWW